MYTSNMEVVLSNHGVEVVSGEAELVARVCALMHWVCARTWVLWVLFSPHHQVLFLFPH